MSITEVATTMRTRFEPVGEFDVDDMEREPQWLVSSSVSKRVPMSSMPVSTSTITDPTHPATNMYSRILMSNTLRLMIWLCYLIGTEFGAGFAKAS